MFLDNSTIDLSAKLVDGRLPLIVFDLKASNDASRFVKFKNKLANLRSFIQNEQPCQDDETFEAEFPNIKREQIDIFICYKFPPTENMIEINTLNLESGVGIPIIFKEISEAESLGLITEDQKRLLNEKLNKKWWQFWV